MANKVFIVGVFLSVSWHVNMLAQEPSIMVNNSISEILEDTLDIADAYLIDEIKQLASFIVLEGDNVRFPFSEYDSVLVFRFNENIPPYLEFDVDSSKISPVRMFESGRLKSELLSHGRKLSSFQEAYLHKELNDFRNFEWGFVLGANFTTGLIAYYRKGEITSYVHLDSMDMLYCTPKNPITKYGSLSSQASELRKLLRELSL